MIEWLTTIVYAYLLFNVAYLLFFAIAGRVGKSAVYHPDADKKRNIAILIPCYKEDNVILETVQSSLKHNYPSFKVFVAAEGLREDVISQLLNLPIELHQVDFNGKSTKARALHALLQRLPPIFDIVLILDADNTLTEGCLEKLNTAFDQGWQSVQLHRVAKNMNGGIAVLDGISEEINNNIFRKGQRMLGFSSCLIGSAMAFEASVFREIISKPAVLDDPGEDRQIDRFLIDHGIVTEYLDDAIVFDEKVSTAGNFERQRTRWYEAQFSHIKSLFASLGKAGKRGKDFWNRMIINQVPPRLFMFTLMVLVIAFYLVFYGLGSEIPGPSLGKWISLFFMLIIAMLVSIPGRYMKSGLILSSLKQMPVLILSMFKAIINTKPGRKEFLHTPKTYKGESEF